MLKILCEAVKGGPPTCQPQVAVLGNVNMRFRSA